MTQEQQAIVIKNIEREFRRVDLLWRAKRDNVQAIENDLAKSRAELSDLSAERIALSEAINEMRGAEAKQGE
jgi:hypothetical protein